MKTLIWEIFMADDFSFEIVEKCGVVSESKGGWTLELNRVSWSGREAKYDLRSWSPDHKKMGKGVTLSAQELAKLGEMLSQMQIHE